MLDFMVTKDIVNSKITIVVFNNDTDEIKFKDETFHRNFFNGQSTRRAVNSLLSNASEWATKNGHPELADRINEY